jgi:hypothetical protein
MISLLSAISPLHLHSEELRLDEDYLHDDLNIELLMEYFLKFQSKALDQRVKLLFKTYGL